MKYSKCLNSSSELEMSRYRKLPWDVPRVPWESHGNGKYNSSSMGMGKSMEIGWRGWEGIRTLHFPISYPQQASKPMRTIYTIERTTSVGENDPV